MKRIAAVVSTFLMLLGCSNVARVPAGLESSQIPLRSVAEWEMLFRDIWQQEHRNEYLPLSNSGNSWNYYDLAYGIDGLTAMFEATGKTQYLDRALLYIDNMIADAKPSSSLPKSQFKDTYLGWPAFDHPTDPSIRGGEYPLFESYCWRYVAKLLRVMRQMPNVYNNSYYQQKYKTILAFTEKHIFEKWYERGTDNLYRSRTHMTSHWCMITLELYLITETTTRKARYWKVFDNINNHLPNYPSSLRGQLRPHPKDSRAYFWNDEWGKYNTPGQDVAHGNAVVTFIIEAHKQGYEWERTDINALSRLFTDILWIRNGSQNKYAEYLDGSGRGTGWFSDGFIKLGRYNRTIQRRLETHDVGRTIQFYGNGALNAKLLGQ
jgi:hypothetical protein